MTRLQDALREKAAGAVQGTWLVVMPASGHARRLKGALLYANVGGESGWAVFIVQGEVAVALDPRAMIYDDETLRVVWHPRKHEGQTHRMVREWFAKNPDTFHPGTENALRPLGPADTRL